MFKRNANEKKKAFDFYYTELPALTEYLEKQESEGYRLKKIENNMLVFEECEPRNFRYSAEIFKGSSYKEFIESCTLEGWEHVATYNGELYIFRTQNPDAIDIMTDEKEKIKITAKRAILQPGLWGVLLSALYPLYHLVFRLNNGISIKLFETDIFNFISLMLIVLYISIVLLRLFDYLLWQYKIRKNSYGTPYFSFKNTIRKRKIYAFVSCAFLLFLYSIIWWIAPHFFNSAFDLIFSLLLLYCRYYNEILTRLTFDKNERIKKTILTCLVIALITGGAFVLREYNEKYVIENSKTIFSLEEAPISVEELNGNVKSCEDRCDVDGTRFGQLYKYTCDAERYEEDYVTSGYIAYNILVSDYPSVRQKYIDKILKDYKKHDYEYVKVTNPDTPWDYCYIVNWNNENEYDGFAVKDNIIIYIRLSIFCKNDFFDIAYKELFDK